MTETSTMRSSLAFALLVIFAALLSSAAVDAENLTTVETPETTVKNVAHDNDKKLVKYGELTPEMKDGLVTLQFDADNVSDIAAVQQRVRSSLAKILSRVNNNNNETTAAPAAGVAEFPPQRRRRRDAGAAAYTTDGISAVAIDPTVKDQKLRVPVVAKNSEGKVVAAKTLKATADENKDEISADAGAPLESVYVGLPPDVRIAGSLLHRRSIWDQHYWMFIAVLILLAVALLTLVLCCLCFRCRGSRKAGHKEQPESGKLVPVEETIEAAPRHAPLHSAAPPPMREGPTHSAPPTSDEENGWIIPIDQLSPEELEQPEVQVSRL